MTYRIIERLPFDSQYTEKETVMDYCSKLGISKVALQRYCEVVRIDTPYKNCGLFFKNDIGGGEILTAWGNDIKKIFVGDKKSTTSFISKICVVFDGFLAMLKVVDVKKLKFNVYVLNGLNLCSIIDVVEANGYNTVYYYTFHDESSLEKAKKTFKEKLPSVELVILTFFNLDM